MEAVTEKDIFKHLVIRDENDAEERKRTLKKISIFKNKVSHNIFTNEYYVLYEAIMKAHSYSTVLTYNQLYQVIISNVDNLIHRKAINAEEFCENAFDTQEVKETLAELCMVTYEELKQSSVQEDGELTLNLNLYLESWATEEIQKILATQHEIVGRGKKISGKFLQGIEAGHTYYSEQYAKIKEMVLGEVAELNNIIRTDSMSYDEVNKLFKEEFISRAVSRTGIKGLDRNIGDLRKGDLITVMGQPGAGKTRFSANIMYNAIKEGNNILWYALEGNALQAFTLLLARHILETNSDIYELDDKHIFEQTYSSEYSDIVMTAIISLLRDDDLGRIVIKNTPLYDDEVELELNSEWDSGYHFDLVCIDYVSLIMNKKNESPATYLSRLVKKLKSLSMTFRKEGFLLLLPHQLTREVITALAQGKDNTIVGSSDTGEIIKSSDIALALARTEEQYLTDTMTVYSTKTRFAKHIPPLEILSLHGKCYFTDKPDYAA